MCERACVQRLCELFVPGVAAAAVIIIIIRGSGNPPAGFGAGEMKNVFCSVRAKINIKMWEALVARLSPQTASLAKVLWELVGRKHTNAVMIS